MCKRDAAEAIVGQFRFAKSVGQHYDVISLRASEEMRVGVYSNNEAYYRLPLDEHNMEELTREVMSALGKNKV